VADDGNSFTARDLAHHRQQLAWKLPFEQTQQVAENRKLPAIGEKVLQDENAIPYQNTKADTTG